MVTPNFTYKLKRSSWQKTILGFLRKSNCLYTTISESFDFQIFLTHFCIWGVQEIRIWSKELEEITSWTPTLHFNLSFSIIFAIDFYFNFKFWFLRKILTKFLLKSYWLLYCLPLVDHFPWGGMVWWRNGILRTSSTMHESVHYWSVSLCCWWWLITSKIMHLS